MIIRLLRKAFPMLDLYLSIGAAVCAAERLTTWRDDVQVVMYQGQIRIGRWNEYHWELDHRVGTIGVEPDGDDWLMAVQRIASIPYQQSRQDERPKGVSERVTSL